MKTVLEMVEELKASDSEYVSYGNDAIPVLREDAIADIEQMEDESIGSGDWYECDSEGNPLD